MSQGGHTRKMCVHEYIMSCACFSSVSQCRRGGAGGLQLVKGLLLTVDSGGVYSKVYSRSTVYSWSTGFKGVYSLQ